MSEPKRSLEELIRIRRGLGEGRGRVVDAAFALNAAISLLEWVANSREHFNEVVFPTMTNWGGWGHVFGAIGHVDYESPNPNDPTQDERQRRYLINMIAGLALHDSDLTHDSWDYLDQQLNPLLYPVRDFLREYERLKLTPREASQLGNSIYTKFYGFLR